MSSLDAAPMRVPKAAELLASRLRREILSGRLRPGEVLPSEARLIAAVGIGRPALREAQRILESEGLLQVQRGARGGAVVTLPSPEITARAAGLWLQYHQVTLRDVYESRGLIEAAAAERIAYNSDPSQAGELERIIEAERASLDDRETWISVSLGFHTRLVELTGLTPMVQVNAMLREITDQHLSRRRRTIPPNFASLADRVIKAHLKLLGMIQRGDGAQAKEFWRVHMERSADVLFEERSEETVLDLFDETSIATSSNGERSLKASEVLADYLRRRIVHGELTEDEILPPESQLAEALNVGHPALREALRILESESLVIVERGSRGGARVQAPSPLAAARPLGALLQLGGPSINDVYETRMMLESAAARWMAEHGSADSKAALRELVAVGRELVDQPTAWTAHCIRFHMQMVERCGLETFAFLAGLIETIIDRHWSNSSLPSSVRPEATSPVMAIRAQMRLVSLIESSDGPGAEVAWHSYLEGIQRQLGTSQEPAPLNLA